MKYQKILITGGAGFIGSHLTDYLINQGYSVRIMDNLDSQVHPDGSVPVYLNKQAEFIKGDVTQRADWQKALVDVDAVVHFASAVGVGQSMYQIEHYVKVNSLGTAIFLDILANEKHTVKKMLVAGSMSAIGEGLYRCPKCELQQQPDLRKESDLEQKKWEPLCKKCGSSLVSILTDESAVIKSPSVYAINKKNQEDLFLSIGRAYDIPAVSMRFFNVYGPRQSLSNPYTGVTAIFMSRVKNNHPPLINEDGLQSRDFVSVHDVVRACSMALESDKANYEIMHVGSGKATSILQVAQMLIDLSGSNVKPEVSYHYRKGDVRHCTADISKIKKLLGWEPQVSFSQGLKELYEWSKTETAVDQVDKAVQELKERGLQ